MRFPKFSIANRSVLLALAAVVSMTLLSGCVVEPQRSYSGHGNYGYRPGPDGYARCQSCGTVERIERVYGERSSSGGGAVLGGIIGGILGSQVGSGHGRDAATVVGAIAGAATGNEIEKTTASAPWFDLFLRMDDGRRIVISQRDLNGIHQGAYVRVSQGRAYLID